MLRIHGVIIETIRLTAPLAGLIARQDRDLAGQYRRASHYSIALGSAEEAWSTLLAAEAWGVAVPAAEVGARFRQIIGTLHRVVHG